MFTLFPNSAVLHNQNQLWLEVSTPLVIDALHEAGVPLAIAAQQHSEGADGNYSPLGNQDVRFISIGTVAENRPTWRRFLNYLGQIKPIVRTVRGSEFCYIYTPGHVGLLAVLSCWLLHKPYAIYLRGDFYMGTPRLFHGLQRRILSKARFVLCTGNKLREKVAGFNPNAEAVVPMSPVLFVETDEQPVSRSQDEAFTILFVGQMLRDKGIFELLAAFERVATEVGGNAELLMVGEGKDKPLLMQQIEKKGLADRVQCMGSMTDPRALAEVYRRSDIFCLPTYGEGFPRVLYEAMRFSLPILTTPVGQITTVIQDGKNGLLCTPRSVESLTEKLLTLVGDASLRRRLGIGGHTTLAPLLEQWRGQTHGHQVLEWLRRSGFPTWHQQTMRTMNTPAASPEAAHRPKSKE